LFDKQVGIACGSGQTKVERLMDKGESGKRFFILLPLSFILEP
jgi:hypothetical protein